MLLLKTMAVVVSLLLLAVAVARVTGQIPSNALNLNEGVIVQLFEWRWDDIALECEEFLAPRGFKAVQISPPNENLVIANRPWWERYQTVSYQLETRSGTEQQLADMIQRCNAVGIRIVVDTVINHMTADAADCHGTAGSTCDPTTRDYPAVPYRAHHFHSPVCQIVNYEDLIQCRVCELVTLHDLNQTEEYVRDKIVDYMNHLIDLGVGGFRIDAAKHMFSADLGAIYGRLNDLNTVQGLPSNTKPLIYQEVVNQGDDLFFNKYTEFGLVTDFRYGIQLGPCFKGNNDLKWLNTFSEGWGLPPGNQSLVFVENHDTERQQDDNIPKYFDPKPYKMAIAFMLSYPHGSPKVMSSFRFTDKDQGPPHDSEGNILSPRPITGNVCSNGWVCQHRWRQVYNMVRFHNVVSGTPVQNWWDNGKNQISFCRGKKGFVAFNKESYALNQTLQTCLPKGTYCDVISGNLVNNSCTGKTVTVGKDGTALIYIAGTPMDTSDPEADGVLAIHVQSKVRPRPRDTVCGELREVLHDSPVLPRLRSMKCVAALVVALAALAWGAKPTPGLDTAAAKTAATTTTTGTDTDKTKTKTQRRLDLDKGVIVQLFEWTWNDVGMECEEFLAFHEYKAVQISPPSENLLMEGRSWKERYQPVSYKLNTRSGTESEFIDMLKKCNHAGIRVIADVVINHMATTDGECVGTGQSTCDSKQMSYPAVPYSKEDFHSPCTLTDADKQDAKKVRECQLMGAHDLDQSKELVRQKILKYLNRLVGLGVAGFRIKDAKNVDPKDLEAIFEQLDDLPYEHGFPCSTKPLIYQDVEDLGQDPIKFEDYQSLGLVSDYGYGEQLGPCFKGKNNLKWLNNFGTGWGLKSDDRSVVFIDNHETERKNGNPINHKTYQAYKMALAFMLAWPHGTPEILSGYRFEDPAEGPPTVKGSGEIKSPRPIVKHICQKEWACQHRWREVYNMVKFNNVVKGTKVEQWWDNGKDQISFCRGEKGFVAFNMETTAPLKKSLQTCLPKGTYCDVISGHLKDNKCTGKSATVAEDGTALIEIDKFGNTDHEIDGVFAIHTRSKIQPTICEELKSILNGVPQESYPRIRAFEKVTCM